MAAPERLTDEQLAEVDRVYGDPLVRSLLAEVRASRAAEREPPTCTCVGPNPACPNCNGTGKVTP